MTEKFQFVECDDCGKKPGMPTLCSGCLSNRGTISLLSAQLRASKDLNKGLSNSLRDTLKRIMEFIDCVG